MKQLFFLMVIFGSAGCVYHGADFRTEDAYGSRSSSTSSNPFHNGSSVESRQVSLMQSCLNRLGHTVEAEEECAKSVRRSMPGAYILVYTREYPYGVVIPSK